jgi:hypothetical protein
MQWGKLRPLGWATAIVVTFVFWQMFVGQLHHQPEAGYDAHAYWAFDIANPYQLATVGRPDAFLYSPVIAQLLLPFHLLPFDLFYAGMAFVLLAVYLWMAGPLLGVVGLFLPPVIAVFVQEVRGANIHLLLAAALVIGFRWPAAWSFLVLTKVTPGVALLWYAVRREWRSLGIAAGATAALVAISALVAPGWWGEWIGVLKSSPSHGVLVRTGIAALIVVIAARLNQRWMVAVAVTLAMPVLWFNAAATLIAIVPLVQWRRVLPRTMGIRGTKRRSCAVAASTVDPPHRPA